LGVACTSSTFSTSGSYLEDCARRRKKTGPGERNHAGTEKPQDDRRLQLNNRSCGVVFVAVPSNERIEWGASGNTHFHGQFTGCQYEANG